MKNRVNKQIIKALSVGLAASMALQPVTAFAEGETLENATNKGEVVDTTTPAEKAANEYSDAVAKVDAEVNAPAVVVEPVNAGVNAPVVEPVIADGNVPTAQTQDNENNVVGTRPDEKVATEADSVKSVWEEIKEPTAAVGITEKDKDGNDVNTNDVINDMVEGLSGLTSDGKGNDLYDDAKNLSEDVKNLKDKGPGVDSKNTAVDTQVKAAETLVNGTDNTLGKISDSIDKLQSTIDNASTITEATNAYNIAVQNAKVAEKMYNDAVKALSDIETEYNKALKAAEDAQVEYNNLYKTAGADLVTAENNLKAAKKLADDLAQKAEDAKNSADAAKGAYETQLENLEAYKDITEAKASYDAGTIDASEYAKVVLTTYIRLNGGSVNEESFNSETIQYVGENGVAEQSEAFTYVSYTDSEGNAKKEYYKVSASQDGTVNVTTLDVTTNDTETVAVPGTPAVEGRDAGWYKADGTNFNPDDDTDTIHGVKAGDADDSDYLVIDTATSKDVSSDSDKAVKAPETIINGNTTITYEEVANSENTSYEKTEYTVVDSYNTKDVCIANGNARNTNALKDVVNNYEGKDVTVKVYALGVNLDWIGIDTSYEVDPNNPSWFDKFSAWSWGSGFNYTIMGKEEDKTSPKETHDEAGVYEIVSKEYKETTTTITSHDIESEGYGYWSGIIWHNGRDEAKSAMNAEIKRLKDTGCTVTSYGTSLKIFDGKSGYYYEISYTEKNTSTKTVTKEVSRTKYAAETYNYSTEIKEQAATRDKYVQEVSTSDKTAISNYQTEITSYNSAKTNKENAEAAVADYLRLKAEAEEAKDAVSAAEGERQKLLAEIAKLDRTKKDEGILAGLQERLLEAKNKLIDAKEKLAEINEKVNDAEDKMNQKVAELTPTPSGDDDTTGGTTGGGDGTTTFIPVAVTPATNVVAPAADNAQAPAVLGARTTRRSSAKSAADTDAVATDNGNGSNDNTAVAGAQKEETKTPEAPKTESTIEETETALAATPELEEKGFAWWWLLILAAIAGVSVEEYARRKSNKAKAEAKDDAKINK